MHDITCILKQPYLAIRRCVLAAVLVSVNLAHAVPANPKAIQLFQPDGTSFQSFVRGDEFQGWQETSDGYTVIKNPVTDFFEYAAQGNLGELVPSGLPVVTANKSELSAPIGQLQKGLRPPRNTALEQFQREALNAALAKRIMRIGTAAAPTPTGTWAPTPVTGAKKILLILVNFQNASLSGGAAAYWSDAVHLASGPSVAKYYQDNSFGTVSIAPVSHTQAGSPAGVVTVSLAQNHPNCGGSCSYATESAWINSVLSAAAAHVNFPALDTNGNGTISVDETLIYFVLAGYESSAGSGLTPSIWAHAWGGPGVGVSGKVVNHWALNGEMYNTTNRMTMGVVAHEMGHAMGGLPDMYDITGNNGGIGIFSLMAAGSWGAKVGEIGGTTPVSLDAFSRQYLGWSTPQYPADGSLVTFDRSLSSSTAPVMLMNSAVSTSEYWLVENRPPTGWDAGMYTSLGSWTGGLLVQHIDLNRGSKALNNFNAYVAGGHQGNMAVEPSTATCTLKAPGTSSWGGCKTLLYYSGNSTTLNGSSTPNSNYYNGSASGLGITSVSAPSASMTAIISQGAGGGTLPSAPTIGAATAGNASVSVAFTPGAIGSGTLVNYTADCGGVTRTGTASPINVTGLTNGSTYNCKVKATSSVGVGPWSAASNTVTPFAPLDTTSPTVPTGLGATPTSSSQINLSWTASTDNVAVTSYKVYRGGVQVGSPAGTSYSDTGLSAATLYSYTVSACDAAANCSAQSSAATATTQAIPPNLNVALTANGGVASASSTLGGHPASVLNNDERTGGNWSNGLMWSDATAGAYPDWVQINFAGTQTIDRVVLYTMQNNYTSPVEPSNSLTFSLYGVTGFTVQTWNGSAWVTQATVTGNNLVKRTVTFAPVATDRIRVNINSSVDGSSYVAELEAWTPAAPDTTPPSVPTGLGATPTSSSQINLSWTASTDNVAVTSYKVYRGGVQVGSPAGTSYSDTGLSAGTLYSYTVSACDAAANCSAQSSAATVTTPTPDSTPPSVPTGLGATPTSSSQINLSWTASTDNVAVTSYKVYRGGVQVGSPAGTSYSDTGLSAATLYSYTVSACDAAANCSAQSSAATATTQAIPPNLNVALTANGGVASASSTLGGHPASVLNNDERTGGNWSNGLMWSDATAGAYPDWVQINFAGTQTIDRVVLYTMQNNYTSPVEPSNSLTFSLYGVTGFTVQTWNGSAWVTQATVTGNNLVKRTVTFAPVATDRIRVNINSSVDGSSYVAELEAWTPAAPDTTPPSVPTGLGATPTSSSQINLSWTASTDNVAVTSYKVYRGGVQVGSPAGTSYSDTGLSAGTLYSYTVSACDAAANCSAQSSAATVTTPTPDSTPPSVPTGLGATPTSSSQINLSWTASTDNVAVTSYKVYRGGVQVGSPAGTSYSDTGLSAATLYSYTVSACDAAANCSAQSSAATATTQAIPPNLNVALTANGGVASASSTLGGHPASVLNNDERTGGNWSNGLMWSDATAGAYPDWVQINFAGTQTIDRVVLYTMQNNYTSPVEPSNSLTFSLYGVTGFTVQTWNGSAWVTQATVTGNNLVKRTVTFAPVATDRIRVNINSSVDGSSYVAELEAWTPAAPDTTPPSVPTGLGATPTSSSQINLSWTASTDNVAVTSYKVYRGGVQVGSPAGTSYSDTGLSAGTLYSYTVSACDAAANCSAQSSAATVTTPTPDSTPPSVPTGLGATPTSSSQINLSWTASTDNVAVTSYKVYRGGVQVGSPAGTSYSDTGLSAATLYSYTVSACDAAANCSAQSSAATATTQAIPPNLNVALTANGGVASASSTLGGHPASVLNNDERTGGNWSNGLMWSDATAGAYPDWVQINFAGTQTIDRVVLYTMQNNYTSPVEPSNSLTFSLYGVTGFTVQTWNGSAWVTQATVTGNNLVKRTVTFAPVATDRIRVNINSSVDGSSYVAELEAWTPAAPDTTPPSVPTGLGATPTSSSQINLSWTASTDNVAVTSYKVYRGGVQVGSPAGTSYSDTGLSAGTLYSYTVSACDAAANCSAQSSAATATTNVIAPNTNVALSSAGGVATASSTMAGHPVSMVNNNERTGGNWTNGQSWADATAGAYPDWVQINFAGAQTIDRVVLYTMQDNYATPVEPTNTLTFTKFGVTGFTVQTWNGSAWVTQATITGNNLVKRTVSFAPVSTDRIRLNITASPDGYSYVQEIEALTP
jgi:M6 family metalloprotease-like protein